MAEPGRGGGGARKRDSTSHDGVRGRGESAELRRLRGRIDALDRRIVRLLNERAELGREVGRAKRREGRRGVRDVEREREVLLRVAMANGGPLRQADLLAIYQRLVAATRRVEAADGAAERDQRAARRDGLVAEAGLEPSVTMRSARVTGTTPGAPGAGPHGRRRADRGARRPDPTGRRTARPRPEGDDPRP